APRLGAVREKVDDLFDVRLDSGIGSRQDGGERRGAGH
ncbi:hypothetical protein LCGC14_2757630, partial [marine sediment metagenome]